MLKNVSNMYQVPSIYKYLTMKIKLENENSNINFNQTIKKKSPTMCNNKEAWQTNSQHKHLTWCPANENDHLKTRIEASVMLYCL